MPKTKNDKIKLVKKSNILLLKVLCSDEYFNDCSFAVFKLTKEVEKKIKEVKTIREIVGTSVNLYKITYWNPFGMDFNFLDDATDLEEKLFEDVSDKEDEIQFLNAFPESKGELRIECEMMHVYDTGIRFEGYVKNTNVKLETNELSFKDLGVK